MIDSKWFDYRDKMSFSIPITKTHFDGFVFPKVFRQRKSKWQKLRYRRKKKKYVCPICRRSVVRLFKYHVSYIPEIIIYACRNCNHVEFKLRTGLPLTNRQVQVARRIVKGGFTYKIKRKIEDTKDYSVYRDEYIT